MIVGTGIAGAREVEECASASGCDGGGSEEDPDFSETVSLLSSFVSVSGSSFDMVLLLVRVPFWAHTRFLGGLIVSETKEPNDVRRCKMEQARPVFNGNDSLPDKFL